MKRMFFAAILLVAISAASFSKETVAEGKTNSALGDFRVKSAANPVTINGEELKTFVITYQNSPLEVKVAIKEEGKCRMYFVLSDKLSVQYVCNANYFGVEKLDKSMEKDGFTTSDESLNKSEYYHQKVLTTGQGRVMDNTMLIAAYFPRLINDIDELVATR